MKIDLAEYGYKPGLETQSGELGRIVRVDRGECDAATSSGVLRVLSDSQRSQNLLAPVVGDWVSIVEDSDLGFLINEVLPRSNTISRRDPSEQIIEQVLVANIDHVFIVHGLDRPLPPGRLERLLIIAEDSGAEVSIVLTKADQTEEISEVKSIIKAVAEDKPIFVVALRGSVTEGLDEINELMEAGKTIALIGESGAGKSTLINALVNDDIMATGEVRAGDKKGRHTTVTREMILNPRGGVLIDTPGVRSVGIWDAQEALERVFKDLEHLSNQCQFNDCAHATEPNCAIKEAEEKEAIDPYRVERYLALQKELEEQKNR
ncbi:MAG: ribosome small subunit-dependent GTPase A [Actinobacteria bacterium]|nr:ribosome small subunit-dependent GTPase A [Actinomycetota bacterium]